MITGATLFSGIGAPEVAAPHWHWAWHAEIEKFPAAVFASRHPDSINLGDVNADDFADRAAATARPDVLIFGSPCQSFSIAGKRLGLDDPRGNLALVALRLVGSLRPGWFVFENVPGLLSSDGGRDFGAFLGLISELGYRGVWRVLDAQYFGVAQRRRRLFFVGCVGDWRRAAAVLFEPEGMRGDFAPSRQAGKIAAPTISARPTGGGGLGTDFDCDGGLIAGTLGTRSAAHPSGTMHEADFMVAQSLLARANSSHRADAETYVAHTLNAKGKDGTGRGTPLIPVGRCGDVAATLQSAVGGNGNAGNGSEMIVAFDARQSDVIQYGDKTGPLDTDGHTTGVLAFSAKNHGADAQDDLSPTLRAGGHTTSHANAGVMPAVAFMENVRHELRVSECTDALTKGGGKPGQGYAATMIGSAVRRLTPRECERLQGFPDDYTLIQYRGKPATDGPRYKSLGNSMAVPVVRWILSRIEQVQREHGS